jgi:hypothetical protein
MMWIRFRRDEANGAGAETAKIRLCAVCRAPATYLGYDGLDPNEQRHPDTAVLIPLTRPTTSRCARPTADPQE